MKTTKTETKMVQTVSLVTLSCWNAESFDRTARRHSGKISDGTRNDLTAEEALAFDRGERGHLTATVTVTVWG